MADYGSNEQQFRTDDGSLFSNIAPRWRTAQFSFDYIDDADRPGLMAALRYAGISQDFFISLYPEEGGQREVENAYACKFKQHPAVTNTAQNNYKIPLIVEEC